MRLRIAFVIDNFEINKNVCDRISKPVINTLNGRISNVVYIGRNQKVCNVCDVLEISKGWMNINMFLEASVI